MIITIDGKKVNNVEIEFDDIKEMLDFGCVMYSTPSMGALDVGQTTVVLSPQLIIEANVSQIYLFSFLIYKLK